MALQGGWSIKASADPTASRSLPQTKGPISAESTVDTEGATACSTSSSSSCRTDAAVTRVHDPQPTVASNASQRHTCNRALFHGNVPKEWFMPDLEQRWHHVSAASGLTWADVCSTNTMRHLFQPPDYNSRQKYDPSEDMFFLPDCSNPWQPAAHNRLARKRVTVNNSDGSCRHIYSLQRLCARKTPKQTAGTYYQRPRPFNAPRADLHAALEDQVTTLDQTLDQQQPKLQSPGLQPLQQRSGNLPSQHEQIHVHSEKCAHGSPGRGRVRINMWHGTPWASLYARINGNAAQRKWQKDRRQEHHGRSPFTASNDDHSGAASARHQGNISLFLGVIPLTDSDEDDEDEDVDNMWASDCIADLPDVCVAGPSEFVNGKQLMIHTPHVIMNDANVIFGYWSRCSSG